MYNDPYQNGKLIQHGTITYSGVSKAMQNDYPEIVDHSRIEPFGKVIISSDAKKIGDQDALAVDNSFLSMFSYDLVAGDRRTALQQPYSLVITASAAKRYFGDNQVASALGKAVIIGTDSIPYKITGVIKDIPANSHLAFDVLISYVTMLAGRNPYKEADYNFTESNFWHYVQLRPGMDYKALEVKFPAFSVLQRNMSGYTITFGLLGLMLLGIFVSAFYPAFVLSSFRPILVLKGKFSASKKGIILRKGLVIGQVAITVALIVGSLVVYRQIRFMNKQDLGMNIDHIINNMPMTGFSARPLAFLRACCGRDPGRRDSARHHQLSGDPRSAF